MAQVRMYVQKGCPHCEAARNFLTANNVSVESIEIGFDPILQAGLRAAYPNGNFQVPTIVSFGSQELIAGNDTAYLQRIVDSLRGAITPNSASA